MHELEGGASQSNPTGYRMDGEHGVAAADVIHPGRVWLDKQLDASERGELSCLMAGLLLYKPPRE